MFELFSRLGLFLSLGLQRTIFLFKEEREVKEEAAIDSAVNATDTGAAKLKEVTSNKEYGIECKLLEKGL